jgi:hypothetical protein
MLAAWMAAYPFSSVTTKHNFVNTVSFITFLFVKDFGKVVELLLSNSMFPVLCLLCVYVFHCSCVCFIVLATCVSFTLRVSTVYDVLFPV